MCFLGDTNVFFLCCTAMRLIALSEQLSSTNNAAFCSSHMAESETHSAWESRSTSTCSSRKRKRSVKATPAAPHPLSSLIYAEKDQESGASEQDNPPLISNCLALEISVTPEPAQGVNEAENVTLLERLRETVAEDWLQFLEHECRKPYWTQCWLTVQRERLKETVFPPEHLILRAFNVTPLHMLKVVILGQDPYHGAGQAVGLAFSVPRERRVIPPSLVNIYREITQDPSSKPAHGDLLDWATQGVLLLNTILTVREGKPMSHKHHGWEQFTDTVLKIINKNKERVVFLFWGKPAQRKGSQIDTTRHLVLTAGHPSPLSVRHFRGCDHFRKANEYLISTGKKPIDWMRPWSVALSS